jgi:SAM-dependent methyltransferase
VAKAYRWMEYATFAHNLQLVRAARLDTMRAARSALVMGDGDGRFLRSLLAVNPQVHVDAVDSSAIMLRLARERAASLGAGSESRVTWHHADARLWQPRATYDLVVTHFFLDCFSSAEVLDLVRKSSACMAPNAQWVHSDFAIPAHGLMRWPSAAIVNGLYFGFRVLTGLDATRLPDDATAFAQAGLHLQSQELFLGGLMKSEIWGKRDL